jgi:hypothetical protein
MVGHVDRIEAGALGRLGLAYELARRELFGGELDPVAHAALYPAHARAIAPVAVIPHSLTRVSQRGSLGRRSSGRTAGRERGEHVPELPQLPVDRIQPSSGEDQPGVPAVPGQARQGQPTLHIDIATSAGSPNRAFSPGGDAGSLEGNEARARA